MELAYETSAKLQLKQLQRLLTLRWPWLGLISLGDKVAENGVFRVTRPVGGASSWAGAGAATCAAGGAAEKRRVRKKNTSQTRVGPVGRTLD